MYVHYSVKLKSIEAKPWLLNVLLYIDIFAPIHSKARTMGCCGSAEQNQSAPTSPTAEVHNVLASRLQGESKELVEEETEYVVQHVMSYASQRSTQNGHTAREPPYNYVKIRCDLAAKRISSEEEEAQHEGATPRSNSIPVYSVDADAMHFWLGELDPNTSARPEWTPPSSRNATPSDSRSASLSESVVHASIVCE